MRNLVVIVGALVALVLTGCGSGGNSSGAGGTIKIYQLAPIQSQIVSLPFMKTSAEAAVAAINAAGGVNGTKLELVTCDEKWDPNEAIKCAQEAVAEKAAAVVGSLTAGGSQVMPILESAGIPYLGGNPASPIEAQSKASYLIDSGVPGYSALPIAAAKYMGAKKVVATMLDNSNVPSNEEYLKVGDQVAGVNSVGNIIIPADAVDYSLYAQRLEASGADAIMAIPAGPDQVVKIYNSLKAIGSDLKMIGPANSFPQSAIDQAGKIADGTWLISGIPNADGSNEWGKAYVAEMAKYKPGEKVIGTVGMRTWAALHLFVEVAKTVNGDVTSKTLTDALKSTTCLDFMWLKCLDYSKDGPIGKYPRVPAAAATTFLFEVVNGKIEARKPFNPFE